MELKFMLSLNLAGGAAGNYDESACSHWFQSI